MRIQERKSDGDRKEDEYIFSTSTVIWDTQQHLFHKGGFYTKRSETVAGGGHSTETT
jgi:hypothetical protein